MTEKKPKKLYMHYILEVLKKHTDEEHRISQQKIADLVFEDYGMKIDRKTVRHNLSMLLEADYPLVYTEHHRTNKCGAHENIMTDWYFQREHKWDESELCVMIDSLLFSNYLPKNQCDRLVMKIAEMGEEDFQKRVKAMTSTVGRNGVNKSLFYTISLLNEAAIDKKQVQFRYCDYGTDFKLHPRTDDNGEKKLYTVSPYKLLSLNGRYYMLGNPKERDGVSVFRTDRITDISITDEKVVSVRSLKGFENGIDLGDYVREHPNMWAGEVGLCRFRCQQYLMNDIVDWFGTSAGITTFKDGSMEVRVRVSEDAMLHWAIQYADQVEVLFPESLRMKIGKTLREAADRYK
jgi:predicted DNA-binding transcriptional regulator YafY